MALASGVRLGPYEIVSALGAGGMGEVYKARDTRLDGTVAIKVLPEHVASDTGVPVFYTTITPSRATSPGRPPAEWFAY